MTELYETLYIPGARQLGLKIAEKDRSIKNGQGVTYRLDSDAGEGYFWAYAINQYCGFSLTDVRYKSSAAYKYAHPSFFVVESCRVEGLGENCEYPYHEGDNLLSYYVQEGVHTRVTPQNMHTYAAGFCIMPEFFTTVLAERYQLEVSSSADLLRERIDRQLLVPEINSVISQVISYVPRGQTANMFYEAKLLELCAILLDDYPSQVRPRMSVNKTDVDAICRLALHLKSVYNRPVDFQRLTAICYMSKTKMNYIFKEVYGMTIMEYVQSLRLNKARVLLAESSASIRQISEAVGYMQQGTFTDFFRRSTGLTPTAYRKKYRWK